jgi:mono/diheme cytochrome c family protein
MDYGRRVRPTSCRWHRPGRALVLSCAGLAVLTLAACDSPPSATDLSTWSPQDHDHSDEKERVASGAQAAPAGSGSKDDGARVLIESTWRNQCASCHGLVGHGDGPSGPMVKAQDLTRPDWQAGVTDAQLTASITNGKNRMPRFDLPPTVVAGLVVRIRASRGH